MPDQTMRAKHAEPTEVWLRPNRRAQGVGLGAALLLAAAGLSGVYLARGAPSGGLWLEILAWLVVLVSGYFALALAYQMTLPRLAHEGGCLLVYLTSARPERVPIEIVELFFLGQGSSLVPAESGAPAKTFTVVARLAEAATEWHERRVKPALGEWREGYIIVRGTWCEPLTPDVIQRLNRRLVEVHRQRRALEESSR